MAVDAGDEVGEVATHTSFVNCQYTSILGDRPPRPTIWLFLTGATNKPSSYLVEMARSWLNPAKIETGYERDSLWGMACGRVLFEGYAYSERAYTFRKFGEDKIKFTMRPKVPVINPVFVINGWERPLAKVSLDGRALEKKFFKWQQVEKDLVLWIDQKIVDPTEVEIFSR